MVQTVGKIRSSCCKRGISVTKNNGLPSGNPRKDDKGMAILVVSNKKGRDSVSTEEWDGFKESLVQNKVMYSMSNIKALHRNLGDNTEGIEDHFKVPSKLRKIWQKSMDKRKEESVSMEDKETQAAMRAGRTIGKI